MGNINLKLRLRPIRFGFIVRPNDKENINKIFKINTCLWGGQYNPVIPYFNHLPDWWTRGNFRFDNAKQVINGYLDFFEPDFIVETENGLSKSLGFSSGRVIQFSDIFPKENNSHMEYGLNVIDLYQDLYKKEFQFVRRNDHNIIDIDYVSSTFEAFSACLFGDFPKIANIYNFKEIYKQVFDPEKIKLDANSLQKIYEHKKIAPLQIGLSYLKKRNTNHHRPTIFMLDATKSNDLIDFWNFRAVYGNALAIPIQWLNELAQFCRDLIKSVETKDNYTVMFSRSINKEKIDDICSILRGNGQLSLTIQDWYPSIWRPSPQGTVRKTPTILIAKEKDLDIPVDTEKPTVQFSPLYPAFTQRDGDAYRWANVIKIQSCDNQDQIATVFPSNYRNPSFPQLRLIKDTLLSTAEGLVIFPKYKNIPERWNLIDGATAFNEWFKINNLKGTKLSEAGKSTQQIIQSLGGFSGVRSIANGDIINLLNDMSKSISQCQHTKEFQNKVKTAVKNDFHYELTFDTLIQKQAVKLGLEVKCTKCESWSWYSLNQMDYSLICSRCLKQFFFPSKDSKQTRYSYRVIGPFSLPDFAKGGYSSALAIRFFADVIGKRGISDEVTWSAGQNLTLNNGQDIEVDFILWYQRKMLLKTDYPIEIVFGEAKSFGMNSFNAEDIGRMKKLAITFPGSILVFATLKEHLSLKEVKLIKTLAEWGRRYDKETGKTKAPVIVLTGTELFTDLLLENTRDKKEGNHKQLTYQLLMMNSLRNLANLTQQLYLNMPSYDEWIMEKWQKKFKER